MFILSGSELDA